MNNKKQALQLIGLAYRAGKVARSEDGSIKALQSRKATIVFVAVDASDRTKEQMKKKCFFYNVPIVIEFTTEDLSSAIGRPMCKILTITDHGFKKALENILQRGEENES